VAYQYSWMPPVASFIKRTVFVASKWPVHKWLPVAFSKTAHTMVCHRHSRNPAKHVSVGKWSIHCSPNFCWFNAETRFQGSANRAPCMGQGSEVAAPSPAPGGWKTDRNKVQNKVGNAAADKVGDKAQLGDAKRETYCV
jgi:hypothetical protein